MAQIKQAEFGAVDMDFVLGMGGYDIDRIEYEVEVDKSHCSSHQHDAQHAHHKEHYHHDHAHESAVTSVSIVCEGNLDLDEVTRRFCYCWSLALTYSQSTTADWWSVGVILFELIIKIPPFNAEHPQIIFDNILNHNPWLSVPEDMSFEAQDSIDRKSKSDRGFLFASLYGALKELWNASFPEEELTNSVSERWKEMG